MVSPMCVLLLPSGSSGKYRRYTPVLSPAIMGITGDNGRYTPVLPICSQPSTIGAISTAPGSCEGNAIYSQSGETWSKATGSAGVVATGHMSLFFGDLFHITKTSITYYHVISCPCLGHLFHTTLKRVSAGGEIEIVWGGDKRKAFTTSFTNPWSTALGADTKRVIAIIRGKIWAAPKHSGVGDETTYWKLFRMCSILEELE